MAGPSLNGITTGWTASSLTPVASTVAAVRKQSPTPPPGMPDPSTLSVADLMAWGRYEDAAVKRAAEQKARLNTAKALEAEAQASNDPAKLRDAWEAFKRASFDVREGTFEGQKANLIDEEQHRLAVEFKQRNPDFQFGTQGGPLGLKEKLIFEAPQGQVRSFVSQRLFQETGMGTGTQKDTDTEQGLTPRSLGGSAAAPAAAGGTGGTAGGMGGSGGGGASAYDLTAEELAGGGPDPRASAPAQTPLEQLLRTIYPDAPTTGADPTADPRGGGPSPSSFNDVLAYLTSQSSGGGSSGYVPSPVLSAPSAAPSNGAQIAATIPGAPGFLAGAINGLGTYGGGYAPAPAAPGGGVGSTLSGLAAISAEQRLQQQQLDAAKKARQDAYFAKRDANAAAEAQAAQIKRQSGGWTSPINFPTF